MLIKLSRRGWHWCRGQNRRHASPKSQLSLFDKGKGLSITCREDTEEGVQVQLYSLLTSGGSWSGWSSPYPGQFDPGKQPSCSLYRKLDGLQIRSKYFFSFSLFFTMAPSLIKTNQPFYSDLILAKGMVVFQVSPIGSTCLFWLA